MSEIACNCRLTLLMNYSAALTIEDLYFLWMIWRVLGSNGK